MSTRKTDAVVAVIAGAGAIIAVASGRYDAACYATALLVAQLRLLAGKGIRR